MADNDLVKAAPLPIEPHNREWTDIEAYLTPHPESQTSRAERQTMAPPSNPTVESPPVPPAPAPIPLPGPLSIKKGDHVWLREGSVLYFKSSVYERTKAAEAFEVIEYIPANKRVYVLFRDSQGKPIALNFSQESIFSVEH